MWFHLLNQKQKLFLCACGFGCQSKTLMQLSYDLMRGAGLLAVSENVSIKSSSYVTEGKVQLERHGMSAWIPKVKFKALFWIKSLFFLTNFAHQIGRQDGMQDHFLCMFFISEHTEFVV